MDGRTLMPGFVDAHAHLGFAAGGITTARDTADMQMLDFDPPEPIANVRFIRIVTTQSPLLGGVAGDRSFRQLT
jgi:cytosine/adenosine deaminase-related metal-dependent hydrolase